MVCSAARALEFIALIAIRSAVDTLRLLPVSALIELITTCAGVKFLP